MQDMALRIVRDHLDDQEIALREGLSIGRDPACDIVIAGAAVNPIHATVRESADGWRLECQGDGVLMLPDGMPCRSLDIVPGLIFIVGSAAIQCIDGPVLHASRPAASAAPVPPMVPVARRASDRCPRCQADWLPLPRSARFCPRCGCDRESGDPQSTVAGRPVQIVDWNAILADQMRSALPDSSQGMHSLIIVGYAAAMANLGLRYEAGLGAQKNEDEAIRCYIKSARLGNDQARERLTSKGFSIAAPERDEP